MRLETESQKSHLYQTVQVVTPYKHFIMLDEMHPVSYKAPTFRSFHPQTSIEMHMSMAWGEEKLELHHK